MPKATILGIPEMNAALARKAEELQAAAKEAVSQEVENIADDARRTAPRKTGALRASIRGDASGLRGTVKATARHATFVEHGTYKDPAQPFMHPAAERARKRFPQVARDIISKALGGR